MTSKEPNVGDESRQLALSDAMQEIDDWVISLHMDMQMHAGEDGYSLDSSEVAGRTIVNEQILARSMLAVAVKVEELIEHVELLRKGLLEVEATVRRGAT